MIYKTCEYCFERFVADKNSRRFCSNSCRAKQIPIPHCSKESWVCMCNKGLGKILTPDIEKCEDCGTEKLFHLSHIL